MTGGVMDFRIQQCVDCGEPARYWRTGTMKVAGLPVFTVDPVCEDHLHPEDPA